MNSSFLYRYAREFPEAYLGHGIGPVPGYGVSYRHTIECSVKRFNCFDFIDFCRRQCIEAAIIVSRHTKIHKYFCNKSKYEEFFLFISKILKNVKDIS